MTTEIDAEGLAKARAAYRIVANYPIVPANHDDALENAIRSYLATTRTSEAEPVAVDDDFVDAAEGIGLYCGDEPNDEAADADPMEAASDAFLEEHPLPYVEGKSPRVALAAAIRAYLAPAKTVITGLERATLPTPASDDQVEAVRATAVEMLEHYAGFIRDHVKADDIEMHPYLPELEDTISALADMGSTKK